MKKTGNNASNKIYNPKNKKPDMPLDADEVDSAMERFIRKKYQEKSLLDGRPEPPRRDETSPTTYSRPQQDYPQQDYPQQDYSPPPPLPPKKGKFFGFGLRASSSSLPLSKHDKKKLPKEPRVDSTFQIPQEDYNSMSRMADARFEMTDADLQQKLATLRDMGFTETERNTNLLRRLHGNVERTIETLVQLGPSNGGKASTRREQPAFTAPVRSVSTAFPDVPEPKQSAEPSYNPFAQVTNQPTVGISLSTQQDTGSSAQTYASNNPFGQVTQPQPQTGLEQSFQSMQLTQPLFPHSTGGYPTQPPPLQDPRFQYSMTPPISSMQYQQGFVASPGPLATNTNPFFQPAPTSAHSTGNNPFLPQTSQQPAVAAPSSPSNNPFLSFQSQQPVQQQQQAPASSNFNPFGIPPSQSSLQAAQQPQGQNQSLDIFGGGPQQYTQQPQPANPFQTQSFQQPNTMQQQFIGAQQTQPTPGFPNFQYGQPQNQPQASQPQPQPQQFQPQSNSFQQQYSQPQQFQAQQNPFQQSFAPQPQAIGTQQTGRYDKNSILSLYGQQQFAPQQLASIPEPGSENAGAQASFFLQQQQVSAMPTTDVFGQPSNPQFARRSATMPMSLSNMHSAGGAGSRNPFMTNVNSTNANSGITPGGYSGGFVSPAPAPTIGSRHTSAESVSINNLEGGRHSPDAFANLSARYMR